MKFRKFGKTVLTAALSSAIVFSLSSCVRSFTVGYMYVTGIETSTPTGNGIISGFKIDNNTGKLTQINGGIIGSGGSNPVRIVLITGGRFVYVLNKGTNPDGTDCTATDPCTTANITQFVVGGNGILTPQETFFTQGLNPFRLIADTSGNFLYALDHDAPSGSAPFCQQQFGTSTCGDITAFSINSTTGRLSLVTNAALTSSSGSQVTYFPIPANPIDYTLASGAIYTLGGLASASPSVVATTPQTVYPLGYNSTTGQLTVLGSTPQAITNGAGTPMGQGTAIVSASSKIYILDNEPITSGGTPGQILTFTTGGSNGNLQALVGGAVADDSTQTSPIYLIVESKGKFVYVANQQGASSSTGAGIAAYTIDPSSGQLSTTPGSPFSSGAQPQCLLEDPSDQYIYTANAGDSTITGHLLDPNSGSLNQMSGSTGIFALNGPASWCVVSGRTN
jgi:6-phosphogluconolactonase